MSNIVIRENFVNELEKLKGEHIIKVVTGLRRSGKSTLLGIFAEKLRNSGVSDDCIQFYNFEEPLFEENVDWKTVYDHIFSKLQKDKLNYIFIDEPQQISGFERLIDGLFVGKNIDLYVTGSNAYFLSNDLATLLSGRYITIHILPFSFAEFCKAEQTENYDKYELFRDYLYETSLPQGVLLRKLGANIQNKYVQDVYNTVIFKDIKQRYTIQNRRSFDNLAKYLMGNIGSCVSPNSISKAMKQGHQDIHRATVEKYIQYLCDSFIFYQVNRFDIQGKQQLTTQEKYYLVDIGFRNLELGKFQYQDMGHILENIVFLELIRRGKRVWIGKIGTYEVDFIVKNTQNRFEYYQVTWSMSNPDTAEREIRPLLAIKDNYPKYIISTDIITAEMNGIEHLNVVDWLLGE
ncbi:MAG: ATP-binding protein [Prevotellaceae bacterium]|jgi:predicted AAA+ superfamily ATPase|nr:ATP-binding protein [Prevotellaceae bacterium]